MYYHVFSESETCHGTRERNSAKIALFVFLRQGLYAVLAGLELAIHTTKLALNSEVLELKACAMRPSRTVFLKDFSFYYH